MAFTKEQVEQILAKIPNGQFFHVDMTTDSIMKNVSAKAKTEGYIVLKHSVMPCRKGIEYTHQKMIAEIMNELGYTVGERKNGTKIDKTFAESKLGNPLVDLYSTDCLVDRVAKNGNINAPKVEYIVNYKGTTKTLTKSELKALNIMQPSFFKEKDNAEKVAEMFRIKSEWESDKAGFKGDKIALARLIRDCYNKMFSVKVENINAIG